MDRMHFEGTCIYVYVHAHQQRSLIRVRLNYRIYPNSTAHMYTMWVILVIYAVEGAGSGHCGIDFRVRNNGIAGWYDAD